MLPFSTGKSQWPCKECQVGACWMSAFFLLCTAAYLESVDRADVAALERHAQPLGRARN